MPESGPVNVIAGEAGLGGVSRQVETRQLNEISERDLPIQQSFLLVAIGVVAILTVLIDIILIGPIIGVVLGFAVFLYAAVNVYVRFGAKWEVAVILPTILWLRFGYAIFDSIWPPFRPSLPLWATLTLLAISIPVFLACYLAGYRMAYEIVDPNWPPTFHARRPEMGITWPGTRFGIPQVSVREVPRPIIVNDRNGHSSQDGPMTECEPAPLPPQATIMSPSGVEVFVSDVVRFIRQAPKIGCDSRTWKTTAGWQWKYWNGVITLLDQLLIIAHEPRGKTKFLVTDFSEMMRRISSVIGEEG